MDHDGRTQRTAPAPRAFPVRRRVLACALLAAALGIGAPALAEPGLRLPTGELAGESWDLVARLDSGHFVVAQAALSNLGPGEHNAAVLGFLLDPDGDARRFKRSEPGGRWKPVGGRRGLDLRSIALVPFGPERSFVVAKDELGIELALAGAPRAAREHRSGACSFELLATAARADAKLRVAEGAAEVATRANAALTHRWSNELEASCLLRRVEVFVLEPAIGVYFSETTAPDGAVARWMVAEREGRALFAGDPGEASVRWAAGAGFAPPERVRFEAGGLAGRFEIEPAFASVDPTERLPAAVQWLVASRTKPRLAWMQAPFELRTPAGTITGTAIAKLTYANPLPREGLPARVAAHSEE